MNIFYLDTSPKESAIMHCDKHCVKMILETAQLLCTAHRELDGNYWADKFGLYQSTHKNHPSAVWVRESSEHYWWTLELFVHLCKEYTARYGKSHKSAEIMQLLCIAPMSIKEIGFTDPPQCMPDEYKCENTVEAYRNYYLGEKMGFAKWNYSPTPEWVYA